MVSNFTVVKELSQVYNKGTEITVGIVIESVLVFLLLTWTNSYITIFSLLLTLNKILFLGNSTMKKVNPFVPNAPFLYLLKTSENRKVFSGGREGVHWEQMG